MVLVLLAIGIYLVLVLCGNSRRCNTDLDGPVEWLFWNPVDAALRFLGRVL